MAIPRLTMQLAILFVAILLEESGTCAQSRGRQQQSSLRVGFYDRSCPRAEQIVRATVNKGFALDASLPAALIRMFFHDCFVRGCDASVLLDNPDSEKLGAPNANSLRGFELLEKVKANLEAACPGVVSCADIIAFAARDSIELSANISVGGWPGGRRDGVTSVSAETLTELPGPFSNFNELRAVFARKGLNDSDLVILSGAHSIGGARCGTILSRLYNFAGTGQADPTLNSDYAAVLRTKCPANAPGKIVPMDENTPNTLDVNYFSDVNSGRGLFQSDNALRTNPSAQFMVASFVGSRRKPQQNQLFYPAFIAAVKKMGNLQVLTGDKGQIRRVCNATL